MNQKSWADFDEKRMIDYIQKVEGKVVLGIDAFIDQAWQVIETRIIQNEYKLKMKSILLWSFSLTDLQRADISFHE